MFKFSFDGEGCSSPSSTSTTAVSACVPSIPASIFTPTGAVSGSACFDVVSPSALPFSLRKCTTAVPHSLSPRADVIPGVYEGGYKLWESSLDLCAHLHTHYSSCAPVCALELGAGHALPAVILCMHGHTVDVHDYNSAVLEDITQVNMHLNDAHMRGKYLAGAWHGLETLCGEQAYDVIVSSETMYGAHRCQQLVQCVWTLLKDEGVAWISGKTYYFGVGAGMAEFKQLWTGKGGHVEVVEHIRDGVSNVREVIRVRKQS